MALKPLNSVGGFSVGENQSNVILANGDITTGNITLTGNLTANGIKTDNYYYANGSPLDFQQPAGSNTQIQFNDNSDFGASANLTFNSSTNVLAVGGNVTATNANLGNVVVANYVTGTLTTAAQPNITSVGTLTSLDVTGNVAFGNVAGGNLVSANYLTGTLTTAAQPNITSVGTLTSLSVTGNVTASDSINVTNGVVANTVTANVKVVTAEIESATNIVLDAGGQSSTFYSNGAVSLPGNLAVTNNITAVDANLSGTLGVTGNISGGNITTTGQVVATGNITGSYFIGNGSALTDINTYWIHNGNSNVSVAANSNVTVGVAGNANILTVTGTGIVVLGTANTEAISANGAITANGNISGGNITVTSNITAGTARVNSITANPDGNGNVVISAAAGNSWVFIQSTGTGAVDVGNARITSLAEPTQATDAATKSYVDSVAEGLSIHAASKAATTTTLAVATGGTVTYNNGTDGVGATLTTTGTYTNIDSVAINSVGTRILVKNEANAAHNGIYTYTSTTVITRAVDFDTAAEMAGGDFTFVDSGTTYADTGWVLGDPVTTVGTTAVNFVQFSGAGQFTAGAGLTLTGTSFSVNVDDVTTAIVSGNVVVKASAQLTTPNIGAATGTSLDVTGNVSANNFSATGIANVTGTITAGNLSTAGTLSVTGDANVGNLGTSGLIVATGNVTGGNFSTLGTVSAYGNIDGGNLTTTGEVSATSNVSGGNLVTSGYVFAPAIVQNASTYDTRLSLSSATGIIEANIAGNATQFLPEGQIRLNGSATIFSGTSDGSQLVLGTTQTDLKQLRAGNITIQTGTGGTTANTWTFAQSGAFEAPGLVNAAGNINGANLTTGGVLSVTGNANVGNIGTVAVVATGNVSAGNLEVTGKANLGAIGNVTITGGANGQIIQTDGSGNLSFATISTSGVSNGTSSVTIPTVNGNIDLTSAGNLTLAVTGTGANVAGTLNVTGNANVGNIGATDGVFTGNLSAVGFSSSGSISSNTLTANTSVVIGDSTITSGTLTTTSITTDQVIASFAVTDVTGVEFVVKGLDSGGRYSMATVQAVTDGTTVDYAIFGGVNIGTSTGSLSVAISSGNIALRVSPSSSNSTVWTTQYRLI